MIKYGKGDIRLARMHVEGVKKLVNLRGGINAVRQTSPLTARMISWYDGHAPVLQIRRVY